MFVDLDPLGERRDKTVSALISGEVAMQEGEVAMREGDPIRDTQTAGTGDMFPTDLGRKVVPVVAGAVLLYIGFFVFADANSTFREMSRVGPPAVMLAIGVSIVSFVVRAVRWHWLVLQVGARVPFVDNLLVSFSGLAMTITPGKAGEVLKSLMLKEAFSVAVAQTAPLLLLERLGDLLAVVILTGLALTAVPGAGLAAALVTFAGALGTGLAMALPWLLGRIPERWLTAKFIRARREKAARAIDALRGSFQPRPFLVALSLSIAAWSIQSLTVWIFAESYASGQVSLGAGVVAYCAPLLAGALALIPGGLGATEASMAGVLMLLTKPPIALSAAAALTILVRLVTFWLAIGLGLLAMAAWRMRLAARKQ
jgi:glycosyltransferase 2 family protein